jgi:RimJ/RimL family protein N-acetyltransferase
VIPELTTTRLTLRGFQENDFPSFASFCADGETANFVGGACNAEDAWRRMAAFVGHWSLRGFGVWALQDRESGDFAGYCGLWYPHGWPEREIAWGLLKSFHGRGFATEAARRVLQYAYENLGWTTLVSCIAENNKASIRVAERLGASKERITENRGWTVGIYRYPDPQSFQV